MITYNSDQPLPPIPRINFLKYLIGTAHVDSQFEFSGNGFGCDPIIIVDQFFAATQKIFAAQKLTSLPAPNEISQTLSIDLEKLPPAYLTLTYLDKLMATDPRLREHYTKAGPLCCFQAHGVNSRDAHSFLEEIIIRFKCKPDAELKGALARIYNLTPTEEMKKIF